MVARHNTACVKITIMGFNVGVAKQTSEVTGVPNLAELFSYPVVYKNGNLVFSFKKEIIGNKEIFGQGPFRVNIDYFDCSRR